MRTSRYRSRVSGPLLDRIDIHIEVLAVRHRELMEERFRGEGIYCNAQMGNRQIRRYCRLTEEGKQLLITVITTGATGKKLQDELDLKVLRMLSGSDVEMPRPRTSSPPSQTRIKEVFAKQKLE